MSLTRFAIRYRPVTYVLLATILGLGLLAIFTLSRREDPDLQGRFSRIIALYPGANARQVEELVTDKLERTLLDIDDMKIVQSTSRPGVAVLTIEVSDQAKDLTRFREDVRNRINDIRPDLPRGVLSVEVDDRFADTSALILGVTQDGATDREREDIARSLRDRLRTLPDVGEAVLLGAQEERIWVSLSSQRLAQYGITPDQMSEAIARRNILPRSGGSVQQGDARFSFEPTGNLTNWRDLNDLVVTMSSGGTTALAGGNSSATNSANGSNEGQGNATAVYLRDVATVTRGYADPSPFRLRINGKPAVGVSLTMRKGRNIIALGSKVDAELAALRGTLPASAQITHLNDLPRSVVGRMAEFQDNLVSGVALIFVVMYLFMGLRSALIVGVMLPITILGTFALMFLFGRDIQQISITALIIALGLVVDNSIVVVDNIERKLSQGREREQAAIAGTDELRVPLLTSNLTTVASFAPLLLLSGGVGEFIRDLGVVTSLATLISLLFNYTIAPLIAARFLRATEEGGRRPNLVRRALLRGVDGLRDGLGWVAVRGLRRPFLTVGVALVGLFGAIALIPRLGLQFFPSAVRNQFTVDVWLPEGRDIEATTREAARVETILRKQKGVASVASYVGQGGPRFYYNISPEAPTPNYAQIVVNTNSVEDTRHLVPLIQQEANQTLSEARVVVKTLEQGPPVGAPVAVRVIGNEIADLHASGEKIKAILSATPGTVGVYTDYGERPLTLKVRINEEQAKRAGLSSQEIAAATNLGYSGATASLFRERDKEIPIQLRLDAKERDGAASLSDLYLPTANGTVVPLRQVATLTLAPEEARIVRRNHVRTLTVFAYTDGSRLASQILKDVQTKIATLALPSGIHIAYGGEQEEVGKTFTEMFLILGLTVAANLIIVVWEFNSFRVALTILAAIPFSMTGAILGLWITHQPFGFMAFLGITSLGGVVTNHAIVLFEYALEEQRHGQTLDQALVAAGRKRLRPILLTVLLSIGGLIPQAVNGGTLWPPLAYSLIFGLLMSLVLTLVIVPSFFKTLTALSFQNVRNQNVSDQIVSDNLGKIEGEIRAKGEQPA